MSKETRKKVRVFFRQLLEDIGGSGMVEMYLHVQGANIPQTQTSKPSNTFEMYQSNCGSFFKEKNGKVFQESPSKLPETKM